MYIAWRLTEGMPTAMHQTVFRCEDKKNRLSNIGLMLLDALLGSN